MDIKQIRPGADEPPFPLLPQQAMGTVLDVILALVPDLESASGRYGQAEASLLDPCASPSHWLAHQVNRDADLVDACADAEQLALILRGRFRQFAEQQGYDGSSILANLNRHPSPWREQAQRCGAEQLPPDVLMLEAAAVLAWSIARAHRGGAQ